MNSNIKYLVESFIDDEEEITDIDLNFDDRLTYVDLGLPSRTLWAKCNLGAKFPEEAGLLYLWGRTDGYKYGTLQNKFKTESENMQETGEFHVPITPSKHIYSKNDVLLTKDDAAYKKLGSNWRVPSEADFRELMLNTTNEYTTINGVSGMKFISKLNNKFIFMPYVGMWRGWKYDYALYNYSGRYWLSNIHLSMRDHAHIIVMSNIDNCYIDSEERHAGLSIRPVYYQK